jgi:hypothetical protein
MQFAAVLLNVEDRSGDREDPEKYRMQLGTLDRYKMAITFCSQQKDTYLDQQVNVITFQKIGRRVQ